VLNFKNTNTVIVVLLLFFTFFIVLENSSFLWLLSLVVLWIGITIIGSFHIRWNYFLKATHHNYATRKNEIALTFDDGPHPIYTLKVLGLLKKHNAKATFFCIGKHLEKYPEIAKKIISEGHLIGNHSYAHTANYGFLTTQEVIEDLSKTQEILKNTNQKDGALFRPPFGVTNPNIAKAVKKLNLDTFGWSIRSYDTTAKSAEKVKKRINKQLKKGAIILLHDTSLLSITVLEQLLPLLNERKIKSVTIQQLFKA